MPIDIGGAVDPAQPGRVIWNGAILHRYAGGGFAADGLATSGDGMRPFAWEAHLIASFDFKIGVVQVSPVRSLGSG